MHSCHAGIALVVHSYIEYHLGVDALFETGEYEMTMIVHYASKKELKAAVGEPLRYTETSMFGPEYRDDGTLTVARRPHLQGGGREFFANVVMKEGLIHAVS